MPVAFRLDLAAKDIPAGTRPGRGRRRQPPAGTNKPRHVALAVDTGFAERNETAFAEYLRLAGEPARLSEVTDPQHVVVVGAGIVGLAAAYA